MMYKKFIEKIHLHRLPFTLLPHCTHQSHPHGLFSDNVKIITFAQDT